MQGKMRAFMDAGFQLFIFISGLFSTAVIAEENKFYSISDVCGTGNYHQIIDGAVLTSAKDNNLWCIISFQTHSANHRFLLRFERLSLACSDHLYIYDGPQPAGKYKENLSCHSHLSSLGTISTKTNAVSLKYETGSYHEFGRGFQLIVTAFKDSSSGCSEFICLNKLCISDDLTCDGISHCVDHSDEMNCNYNSNRTASTISSACLREGKSILFIELLFVSGLFSLVGLFV